MVRSCHLTACVVTLCSANAKCEWALLYRKYICNKVRQKSISYYVLHASAVKFPLNVSLGNKEFKNKIQGNSERRKLNIKIMGMELMELNVNVSNKKEH